MNCADAFTYMAEIFGDDRIEVCNNQQLIIRRQPGDRFISARRTKARFERLAKIDIHWPFPDGTVPDVIYRRCQRKPKEEVQAHSA